MRYLAVKDFKKHQHYTDRRPPWIKLHVAVLDDYAFSCLHDASKAHLMLLWVLASKMDNRIPYDVAFLSRKLGTTEPIDVEELIRQGFLEAASDDSAALAPRKQNGAPETEREAETEAERETEKEPPRSPRKAARGEKFSSDFNALWQRYPKRAGNNPRKRAYRAYVARREAGVAADMLSAGLDRYVAFLRATDKLGTPFVMQGATFFGPDEHYAEPWTPPPAENGAARRGPLVSVTEDAARRQQITAALEERYAAERKRVGIRWAHEHPEAFEPIRADIDATYRGQVGKFAEKAREIELSQRCAAAAGFPSFDDWCAAHTDPSTAPLAQSA